MSNKYSIQGQYENEKISREAQAVGNVISFGQTLTNIGSEFVTLAKNSASSKARDDFNASLTNLNDQLNQLDYETTERSFISNEGNNYLLMDGTTYTLQQGDKVEGSSIFSYKKKDLTQAYEDKIAFLDSYLETSGVLDGKNSFYKEAYTEYFNTSKNETALKLNQSLWTDLDKENKASTDTRVSEIGNLMGNPSSSSNFEAELLNMLGGNFSNAKFEIPEITVENTEETQAEYAKQKIEHDFAVQRNLIYETYRKAYSEQEANQYMDSYYNSHVLMFDYNGASATIDNTLKTAPYLDTSAWVEFKLNAVENSPLLEGRILTESEKQAYRNDLTSLVNQRKQVLSGQISSGLNEIISRFYNQNSEEGAYFSSKQVTSAVNSLYSQLGISKEFANAYMDSNTQKALEALKVIGLENEQAVKARDAVQALSLSDDEILAKAIASGKDVKTAREARLAFFSDLPLSTQSFIYDNPYTSEREFLLVKPDETASGYLTIGSDFSDVPTLSTQQAQDEWNYNVDVVNNGYAKLVDYSQKKVLVDQLIANLNDDSMTDDNAKLAINELREIDGWKELFSSWDSEVASLGDGVDTSSLAVLKVISQSLEAEIDDYANTMANSSSWIANSGYAPTYTAQSKAEIISTLGKDENLSNYKTSVTGGWEAVKNVITAFNQDEYESNQMAIDTWDLTGVANTTMKAMKEKLEKELGKEISYDYVRDNLEKRNNALIKERGVNATSQAVTEYKQYIQDAVVQNVASSAYDIDMWESGYDNINPSNGIFVGAVDKLYGEFCTTTTNKTSTEAFTEDTTKKEELSLDKKIEAVLQAITKRSEIISNATKSDSKFIPLAIDNESSASDIFLAKIQEYGDELVTEKTASLEKAKALTPDLYEKGMKRAQEDIKTRDEQTQSKRQATIDEVTSMAGFMISTGMTGAMAERKLINESNVPYDIAHEAVTCASASTKDNNGLVIANLSVMKDIFGVGNCETIETQVNEYLNDKTEDFDFATKNIIRANTLSRLIPQLYAEAQKENPQYDKLLANFEAQEKKIVDATMASIFGSTANSASYPISTSDERKKAKVENLNPNNTSLIQKYSTGQLSIINYHQIIENSYELSPDNKLLSILANDTSLSDTNKSKYALASAFNMITSGDYYSLEEVENTKLEDLQTDIINKCESLSPTTLGQVQGVSSIIFGGQQTLEAFVKSNPKYDWLALGTKDKNGKYTNQTLHYTPTGYVIECQTVYGNTVYAKPVTEDGKVLDFVFYADENLTEAIQSGNLYALQGRTDNQVDAMNIKTLLTWDEFIKPVVPENKKDAVSAERLEEDEKQYTYTLKTGEVKTTSRAEARAKYYRSSSKGDTDIKFDYSNGGVSTFGQAGTKSITSAVKQLIVDNYAQAQTAKTSKAYPVFNTVEIADGSYKVNKTDKNWHLTRSGTQYTDPNGLQYTLAENGLEPVLTGRISSDKDSAYLIMANEIVSRSNGEVSIIDAYTAVMYAYEGFDKPISYIDRKGKCITYMPPIYEYIANDWFLTEGSY